MTTCAVFEAGFDHAPDFVEMHPGAHRSARQAIARAAAESRDARVYSLIARRAAAIDLEFEFAAFAADSAEWAGLTDEVGFESWATD